MKIKKTYSFECEKNGNTLSVSRSSDGDGVVVFVEDYSVSLTFEQWKEFCNLQYESDLMEEIKKEES